MPNNCCFPQRIPEQSNAEAKKELISAGTRTTWSDPRILKGEERSKFVTSVMNTTFHPERTDKETIDISKKVRTKV